MASLQMVAVKEHPTCTSEQFYPALQGQGKQFLLLLLAAPVGWLRPSSLLQAGSSAALLLWKCPWTMEMSFWSFFT